MVRVQNLSQENSQRNQRRKNPVQPVLIELGQCLAYNPFRQNVSERQISILKETPPQELNLLPSPALFRMAHDVSNKTENRHGINGYLDNQEVAKRIYDALTAP
jgi:hypothetical protein